jgi:hypothetical protein
MARIKNNDIPQDLKKSREEMKKVIGDKNKQELVSTEVNIRGMTEDPEINMMTEDPSPGKIKSKK